MPRLCHRLVLAASVAASVLAPAAASAVTVEQIVALTHSGVTDAVILALIDRDKTIFPLEAEQLVALKAEGVSEPVILAMLSSGREEGDRAAQAEADLRAAMILAERSSAPELLVVGPDAPNARAYGFPAGAPGGGYFPLPYAVDGNGGRRRGRLAPRVSPPHTASFVSPVQPVAPAIGVVVPPIGSVVPPTSLQRAEPPAPLMLCRAEVNTRSSGQPLTFMTACPPIMQPSRRR
jgi:hypothetical protein